MLNSIKYFFKLDRLSETRPGGGMPNLLVNKENIDPDILGLILVLNQNEYFKSHASCQGHFNLFYLPELPYFSFMSSISNANKLIEVMHNSDLKLNWTLDNPTSNSDFNAIRVCYDTIPFLWPWKQLAWQRNFQINKLHDFKIIEKILIDFK